MSLTAGTITLTSKTDKQVKLAVSAATGGTGPYTYQWYRSTTTGFSPGGGNILSGKTALALQDDTVIPGTLYYYKNVVTDTGNSNVTATSTQLAVTTDNPVQNPNQFAQSTQLGQVDQAFNFDTMAVQIDSSQATALVAGAAVKIVDNAGGVPKVVGCAANSDEVLGFLNYNTKNRSFVAGNAAEISIQGNVMWLYATTAIARGARVQLDLTTNGGVAALTGSSGADIVGWAMDKAAIGDLIRVYILTPSFAKA